MKKVIYMLGMLKPKSMRSLLLPGVLAVLISACTTAKKETPVVESRYSYSNSFELADASLLELVRNWNNAVVAGNVDQALTYAADSMELIFADGTRYNTTKDSVRQLINKMLPSMQNLKVQFVAAMPVTSKDKGDTWVLSYTDESYTMEGKPVRYIAHELYRIVDGKIRNIYAYAQQPSSIDPASDVGNNTYSYSGSFEMMDNKYTEIVNGWNDALVAKNFDLAGTFLADSVTVIFEDGTLMNTVKDSLVTAARKILENTDVKIDFVGAMGVRSIDRKDEWVLSWTDEIWTSGEKVDHMIIHEAYQIVNNKIRFVRQFRRKANE
jgi:hypothetical protein